MSSDLFDAGVVGQPRGVAPGGFNQASHGFGAAAEPDDNVLGVHPRQTEKDPFLPDHLKNLFQVVLVQRVDLGQVELQMADLDAVNGFPLRVIGNGVDDHLDVVVDPLGVGVGDQFLADFDGLCGKPQPLLAARCIENHREGEQAVRPRPDRPHG